MRIFLNTTAFSTHAIAVFLASGIAWHTVASQDAAAPAEPSTRSSAQADLQPTPAGDALFDAPLAAYQRELLEWAFKAACELPINPHIKTRCELQEHVVTACLALDQPSLALEYADKIDDWRRGSALAEIAFYCVQNTLAPGLVDRLLGRADSISYSADDWRRDHIRVKIARVHAILGQHRLAEQYAQDVINAETGKVDAALAARAGEEEFDARFAAMNELLESKDFDRMRNGLDVATLLLERFYADEAKRDRITDAVRLHIEVMPIVVRLQAMLEIADAASSHGDHADARGFLTQARGYIYSFNWAPEDRVPLHGRLAQSLHRAGDDESAQKEIDAGVAHYVAALDQLLSVDRARSLLPIAEALQLLGKSEAALATVSRALDEGLANPNIVPRTTDLNAVCLMLASSNLEPTEAIRSRLEYAIHNFKDVYQAMQREHKQRAKQGLNQQ